MEFLRAGEALIRSSQPLLLPFLAPAAHRPVGRIGAISRRYRPQQWQCQSSQHAFSTSTSYQQQSNAAASPIAELSESIESRRRTQPPPPQEPDDFTTELLDGALDLDKGVPGTPTGRTSRFASNTAQQKQKAQSSIDELIGGMSSNTPSRRPSPSSSSSFAGRENPQVDSVMDFLGGGGDRTRSRNLGNSLDIDVDRMLNLNFPKQTTPYAGAPEAKAPEPTNTPAPLKLNSTTGRVIHVDSTRGVDAARAFRLLGSRLAQNNVKRDFQRQRFHERPGLRRKRLKSERWRKRFKEAFQGTVSRVVGLKRQGW